MSTPTLDPLDKYRAMPVSTYQATGISPVGDVSSFKDRMAGVVGDYAEISYNEQAQRRLQQQQQAYAQQQAQIQQYLNSPSTSGTDTSQSYANRLNSMYANAPASGGGSKYFGSSSIAIGQAQGGGNVTPGNANGLINYAKQYIGVPYSWGGGGTKGPSRGIAQGRNTVGFDCSGLVQHVFAKMGIRLPRTASKQYAQARKVSYAQAQPGDIVVFGRPIHHIAIYIGGGKILEAPRTGLNIRITGLAGRDVSGFGRLLR